MRLRSVCLNSHPLSETEEAAEAEAVVEAASTPLGRTSVEGLTRFSVAVLVVPTSSSNRAAAAVAASAEALAVLAFGFSEGAVLAVAWSGKHNEDDRLCLPWLWVLSSLLPAARLLEHGNDELGAFAKPWRLSYRGTGVAVGGLG